MRRLARRLLSWWRRLRHPLDVYDEAERVECEETARRYVRHAGYIFHAGQRITFPTGDFDRDAAILGMPVARMLYDYDRAARETLGRVVVATVDHERGVITLDYREPSE